MAETLRLVVLSDGDTFTDSEGAYVIEFEHEDVVEDIKAGAYDGARDFPPLIGKSIGIDLLVSIARAAAEYRRAVLRGRSPEWTAEARYSLDTDLVIAGLLTGDELPKDEGQS